jgi:methyl-accepting chemotaxis protein
MSMRNGFFREKGLAHRIASAGSLTAAAFFGVSAAVLASILNVIALGEADRVSHLVAARVAGDVQAVLERPLGLAMAMRDSLQAMHASGVTGRDAHNSVIQATLAANPELLGTWAGWEPGALDGRDAEFAGTAGHDATGRFVPYWYRTADGVDLTPLIDYDVAGPGDYYQLPFRSGAPVLIEPYIYPVNGVDTLITSISLPLTSSGAVVGVAGVDMSLADLQARIGRIELPFSGRVDVLSAGGLVVYSGDPALLGQPDVAGRAADGEVHRVEAADGTSVFRAETNVSFAGFSEAWRVRVDLPVTSVLGGAWMLAAGIVLVGVVLCAALAIVLSRLSRRIIGVPLGQLSSDIERLAAGDLTVNGSGSKRSDEIGQIETSVLVFREALAERSRLEELATRQQAEADAERQRAAAATAAAAETQAAVIARLGTALATVAEGNLTCEIDSLGPGGYGRLQQDFNNTLSRLRGTLAGIAAGAGSIAGETEGIRGSIGDVAMRLQSQAASLEEAAAALEEVASTARQAAENAADASAIASAATAEAAACGETVRDAVTAMDDIQTSASEISRITEVINTIAFQTNLLALNASVEAARAGDNGRGFAVVAQEVRALAQRSSDAAREIEGVIASSRAQVERGVRLVGTAGQSLQRIESEIGRIDGIVAHIAASSREQSSGVATISNSVTGIDRTVQANAEIVKEVAAASLALAERADALVVEVSRFNTGAPAVDASAPLSEGHWRARA